MKQQLHTNDLAMNSDRLFRRQLIDNFIMIEQEFYNLTQRMDKVEDNMNTVITEMVKLNNNQDKLQEEIDELYNFGRHDRQVILEHINLEKLR